MEIESINDLITELERIRCEHGNCPVRTSSSPAWVCHLSVSVERLGVNQAQKLVSRGGVPVVVIA